MQAWNVITYTGKHIKFMILFADAFWKRSLSQALPTFFVSDGLWWLDANFLMLFKLLIYGCMVVPEIVTIYYKVCIVVDFE
jgi:hypothetical protein